MWSVVIESPTFTSTRAPSMSPRRPRSCRGRRRTAAPARRWRRGPSRRRDPSASAAPASARRRPRCARTASSNCASVIAVADRVAHLVGARPEVAQEHRPVGALAERLGREVDVDAPRERVRDAQRRRRQVGRREPADAPAPRSSGCRDSTATTLRSCSSTAARDLVDQRAGVADARRAAVADQREPELVEVRREPGAVEVVGHHARARARARSSPTAWSRGRPRPPSAPAARRRASR